ncbi:CYIR protein [Plasmodium cynomolgi strain B]|uniref:CYIR protein n=1 Tax=Plasmodium cynomolgi (strain B) TaxID=1120755 RepID=K6UZV1_PLACD|nr:CYIR protein [Plasmodium cynomolgi strain B]GAB69514.1 CYIR protein [Plasmodium cynomolgi strain B]
MYFKHYKNNVKHSSSKWCSYINFWLNNKIRNEEDVLDNNTFHLYQKFINCDFEIKDMTECKSSDIYYYDEKTFDQVKEIYDLYDDYMDFYAFKNNEDNVIACSSAKACTEKFNIIIKTGEHRNNDHLYNALQDIKHLFEKNGLTSFNNYSSGNIPFFIFMYKFTPIGSLIRRRIGSKNRNIHNFNETYTGTFPDFCKEFGNINYGNDRINIAYYPE